MDSSFNGSSNDDLSSNSEDIQDNCFSKDKKEKLEFCVGEDGYLYARINDINLYKNKECLYRPVKEELYEENGLKLNNSQNIVKHIQVKYDEYRLGKGINDFNIYALETNGKLLEIAGPSVALYGNYDYSNNEIAQNVSSFEIERNLGCIGIFCPSYITFVADAKEYVLHGWTALEYAIQPVEEINKIANYVNSQIDVDALVKDEQAANLIAEWIGDSFWNEWYEKSQGYFLVRVYPCLNING